MGRRRSRSDAKPDIQIRGQDGRLINVEIKHRSNGDGVVIADNAKKILVRINAASAAAIGGASVSGWYPRTDAPWTEHSDLRAIRSDWRTVGDDLYRATGAITRVIKDSGQIRLFDPSELADPKQ